MSPNGIASREWADNERWNWSKLGFRALQDVLQAGSDQLLDILKKLADGDSTLKRYRGHHGSQ
jgi:hypothetical protein